MQIKNIKKRPHRILNGLAAIIVVAFLYVCFSRWPTGYASGDSKSLVATTQPISKATFRVATFNIHSGYGNDNRLDLKRTAKLLEGFDLIGLQETRGYLLSRPQSDELGQLLGLNSLFAANESTRFHNEFGNSLLTRLPINYWERTPMPGSQWSHYRNLLTTELHVESKQVFVNIVHVDRTVDRKKQLIQILGIFKRQPNAILMGDFNTLPDDPLLEPFFECSKDAVTQILPENKSQRVDWIFVRGLEIKNAGIVENDASDHPMVWAELSIK